MGACMNSKEGKKNPVAAFFGAIGKFFKEFGEAAAKGDGAEAILNWILVIRLEKKTNHQGISGNITGNRVNSIYGIDRGAIYQPAEYLRYGRACDGVQPGNDEE